MSLQHPSHPLLEKVVGVCIISANEETEIQLMSLVYCHEAFGPGDNNLDLSHLVLILYEILKSIIFY